MAYFRVAVSPDDDLAFERIVNTPKRGLGDKAQADIQRIAPRAERRPLLEGARLCWWPGSAGKGGASSRRWSRHRPLARALAREARRQPCRTGRDDPGRIRLHRDVAERQDARGAGAAREPQGTVKALENFDNLQGFLEHVASSWTTRSEEARRQGLDHDAARRQGARIPRRLPARLGGRPVPLAARRWTRAG
jgi:DNA helicase II / ATP-dependent DNA helicase PcrA